MKYQQEQEQEQEEEHMCVCFLLLDESVFFSEAINVVQKSNAR